MGLIVVQMDAVKMNDDLKERGVCPECNGKGWVVIESSHPEHDYACNGDDCLEAGCPVEVQHQERALCLNGCQLKEPY